MDLYYLDVTRKNPNRKTLVKLRISNHKLNIETGRYGNLKISRCDRICSVCFRFVLFVASILKMRFTFCLIAQNIRQLETTFFIK